MIKYFDKHVYEIDIVAVYLQLEREVKTGKMKFSKEISPDELLARLRTSIEVILSPDKIDIDQVLKSKISAVITPRTHLGHYEFWFAFQLMVTNHRTIPLMLQYHLERWQNNISFLNLIEFHVGDIYEKNKPTDCDKNADSLFAWIYEVRKQFGYSTKPKYSKKNHVIDIAYADISDGTEVKESERAILVKCELIDPVAQIFIPFLFAPKDHKHLIAAFKGEALKKPIELTCQVNEFGYLISRLKSEPLCCILTKVDKIRDWAILNFKFFSGKTDQFEKSSASYMRAALVGSRPPGSKRRKELDKLLKSIGT